MSVEDELAELIGEEATITLAEKYGGTRLYIPNEVRENSALASAIGTNAMDKLIDLYGGDYISVPLAKERRVAFYHGQGHSNGRIALMLGMTKSGVSRIKTRLRLADRMVDRPGASTSRRGGKSRPNDWL